MAEENDKRDGSGPNVSHEEQANNLDNLVHGKEKWWNWRVLMNRKIFFDL